MQHGVNQDSFRYLVMSEKETVDLVCFKWDKAPIVRVVHNAYNIVHVNTYGVIVLVLCIR